MEKLQIEINIRHKRNSFKIVSPTGVSALKRCRNVIYFFWTSKQKQKVSRKNDLSSYNNINYEILSVYPDHGELIRIWKRRVHNDLVSSSGIPPGLLMRGVFVGADGGALQVTLGMHYCACAARG